MQVVTASDVGYAEAHGTGTSLGDPIEVKALCAVYGEGRSTDNPLIIGSAKTNIGHAEAAAGVAGLMKCVLAMQHAEIPPHLHFKKLNPYIDLINVPSSNSNACYSLAADQKPRFAAVSSFGFSGTNSHAILQEAPWLKRVMIHPALIYYCSLHKMKKRCMRKSHNCITIYKIILKLI